MKMLLFNYLMALCLLSPTIVYGNLGCPVDKGESSSNSCELEHKQVELAKKDLAIVKQYNYCRIPSADKPNGVGLQCRTFTLYKDSTGKISKDFFSFRFYAAEVHRTVSSETFYVKRSDGLYDTMHDEITDGKFEVNKQLPEWRGIDVSFDNNNFPSYIAKFVKVSGDPLIPDEITYSMIVYSEAEAVLINNVDKSPADQSEVVYKALGPVQFP